MNTSFCSLWDSYKGLSQSYYDIDIKSEDLFGEDAKRKCYDFIHDHFVHGCKESVFDISFLKEHQTEGKHLHTVALYLMGLLMRNVFFPKIKDDLCEKGINAADWYAEREFMYTWYLTCLYHDAASCVEEIKGNQLPCCKDCIFKMKTPYSHKPLFANSPVRRFSKALAKNYCRYRMSDGKQDHGIYGGILLFDRLVKNFKEETSGHDWASEPEFKDIGRSWRLEHLDHYAYVADAIICHNMWTVQASDTEGVNKYKENHLDALIIKKCEDKLSPEKYPLHFMLCLLDTIEPVKRFSKLSARKVLKNVSIEIVESEDMNGIRIAWSDEIKQQPEFWTWMKNISSMKDWMQVNVSPCRREGEWCSVTIDFRKIRCVAGGM